MEPMEQGSEQADLLIDSGLPGPNVCISYGVHGNERAPIDAASLLQVMFDVGELGLSEGKLLLLFGNPRATAANARWSAGGVDLNRCFHPDALARAPELTDLYEQRRAREIAELLDREEIEILVDFHCTVEPGARFCMHHPGAGDEPHREVTRLLSSQVVLADPHLNFGGVSLDEHLSTQGRVGVCYETGWIRDPDNTPSSVRDEMVNLLAGLGLVAGRAYRTFADKRYLELREPLVCRSVGGGGFSWAEGIGQNLQELPEGTLLGCYAQGEPVVLDEDSTLIFPKKQPELVELGKPLVYLASRVE